MGAGTSIGSSVASVNIQRSDTGRKHGKTRQQAQGDELDQASASSLADKYQSTNCMYIVSLCKIIHECVNLPLPSYIQYSTRVARGSHLKFIETE